MSSKDCTNLAVETLRDLKSINNVEDLKRIADSKAFNEIAIIDSKEFASIFGYDPLDPPADKKKSRNGKTIVQNDIEAYNYYKQYWEHVFGQLDRLI